MLARTDAEVSEPLKRALDFSARDAADRRALLACFVCVGRYRRKKRCERKTRVRETSYLALEEGNTTYWTLETNTPFYGWGLAGRVETTALVVQALAKNVTPIGIQSRVCFSC